MTAYLNGQTAVITGATSGIGRSIAGALAKQGMDLCLIGRNQEKLTHTLKDLEKTGSSIQAYVCNLESIENIEHTTSDIIKNNPRVDIVIHSAGNIILQPLENTTAADLDLQYFVNVRAPFFLTQQLLSAIKRQKGQIVFVNSSISQQKAKANLSAYAASKYALMAIADSLREEVNPHGVRILSIYPGRTATAMQENIYKFENREYHADLLLQPDDVAQAIISALTMPRTAEVTDVSIRPFNKS